MNTLLLSFCFNYEVHRLDFCVLQSCGREVKPSLNMMVKENGMLIVSKCWLAYSLEFITHLQLGKPCKFRWQVANQASVLVVMW